ncbi:MAG TPA: hypothetical protein PLR38_01970 [Syntrophorhabdaceae bacterium]|nr:hypothetical protein [Syntrophorhabdaceae bacterium]
MTRYLVIFFTALFFHVLSYIILLKRIEPLYFHFYTFVWWSFIVLMDVIYAIRKGRFLILKRTLPAMIVISASFWCIFELINLRIQNWYYINLPMEYYHRYTGYLLAYGTVVPGIYITKEIIQDLIGDIEIKKIHLNRYPFYAIITGFALLFLTLAVPKYFFSLAWVSAGLIFDGYNYYRGYSSFARDLEAGQIRGIIATMLSGLLCGILWEFWNFWAVTKWIYTVPFFEGMKIFEMPVPGYIGFVVFALETIAFVNLIKGIWSTKTRALTVTFIMACFCAISFVLIDRYTVFSHIARIEELYFISQDKREALKQEGIRTSYRIDIKTLDSKERDFMELLHLKGMGLINLKKLAQYGIDNIDALSKMDDKTLSIILEENNMRRVRVYISAAKEGLSKK